MNYREVFLPATSLTIPVQIDCSRNFTTQYNNIYLAKEVNFYLRALISFNNDTSLFPTSALVLSIPANSSALQPHDIYSGPKDTREKRQVKLKRYMDEGEGKSDRIKAGRTEHFWKN